MHLAKFWVKSEDKKKEWNIKIWEICSLARKGAQERAVAKEISIIRKKSSALHLDKKERSLAGFSEIHEVTAIKDSE